MHPSSFPVYAYALSAVMGYYWDVWNAYGSRLPFIPDTISNGCVCGPVERGWPGHPRLFQPWSVARIHGVGALHVPVVMPVCVGVAPVFDFDRGPGLPPEMLRRFQSRLSFPGNRERQWQALLRAWWWFHHSAKMMKNKIKRSPLYLLIKCYGCFHLFQAQNVSCPSLPLDLWANKSKWPSPAQRKSESRFLNNIKNCHSDNLTSYPKILISFFLRLSVLVQPRISVILTSPGFWWWDTGPAAAPEVWRLVAHSAQADDCIYSGEFIAFYQPLIAETHRSPALASMCVCVWCCGIIAARISFSWAEISKQFP